MVTSLRLTLTRTPLVLLLLSAALLPQPGVRHSLHLSSVVTPVRSGFPVDTDLATARPQDAIIDGTAATTGWFRLSSPTLADLYLNGHKEIVIGSQDGRVYVYNSAGGLLWSRYLDAPTSAAKPVAGTPAVGDIDGDGSPDVVAGSENGWVFAWDANGTLKAGWPQFTGYNADYPSRCATNACTGIVASPTVADIDGDGRAEVIVGSYSHKMWIWHGNGTAMSGWPRDVWDGIASGAAVGDLNGDGHAEIVVGSDVEQNCSNCQPYGVLYKGGLIHAFESDGTELGGWPFRTDAFMHGTPVLADLDHNGTLEVLSGAGFFPEANSTVRGHQMWALNWNGTLRWSYHTTGVILSGPTVADTDNDGKPEVILADTNCLATACIGGTIYLLSQNGSQVNTVWTRADDQNINGGAFFGQTVVGDVDGDGYGDVIEADANFGVRAYNALGTMVMSTTTSYANFGTPAIGDLDGNGTNEVVVGTANGVASGGSASSGAGRVYVFNTPGHGGLLFPQYQTRVIPGHYTALPATAPAPAPAPCGAVSSSVSSLPAVRRGVTWYQRASYSPGNAQGCFSYGGAGDLPVTGDWNGDGTRTAGVFRPSTGVWYLRNGLGGGNADIAPFKFGARGDIPVVGDWNGDGIDTVGVFRPTTGRWYLAGANAAGTGGTNFLFGKRGDIPVVGDWNGDHVDTVGTFRPANAHWYLAQANRNKSGATSFKFGQRGDKAIAGDWNHDGVTTVAVVRRGTWYLKNTFGNGGADGGFAFGAPTDTPLLWGS